jgi:hypothetical protein
MVVKSYGGPFEGFLLQREPGLDTQAKDFLKVNMLSFMLENSIKTDFEEVKRNKKSVTFYNNVTGRYYSLSLKDIEDFWNNVPVVMTGVKRIGVG